MRSIFLGKPVLVACIFAFCCIAWQESYSFSLIKMSPTNVAEAAPPAYLKGTVFANLSVREFEKATNRKLNFFQKIYFKAFQRQVHRDLKTNPDLLITDYKDAGKTNAKFSFLWFVIGSFIGPLGVLLAYTSHEKKPTVPRKTILKSVWIGCALFILWFGFLFIF